MRYYTNGWLFCIDKAAGGIGFVGDHQDPVEFLQAEQNGFGKYGAGVANVAV